MSDITITLDTHTAETLLGFLGEFLDGNYAGEETIGKLYDKLVKEMNH